MSGNNFFSSPPAETTSSVSQAPSSSAIPADVDASGNAKTTESPQSKEHNSVDSIISRLTTGGHTATVKPQPNAQQTQPQQQAHPETMKTGAPAKPTDQAASIIESLNAPYKGENLTAGFDINKIAESIRSGDLTELQAGIEATAAAAVERANRQLLSLIPDIISAAREQTLAEVNQGKGIDSLWARFIDGNESFSSARSMIEPQLLSAVEGGASEKDAFQAVATIYAGLKRGSEEDDAPTPDPRNPASKTFNLEAFVK